MGGVAEPPGVADWLLLPLRPWTLGRVAAGARTVPAVTAATLVAWLLFLAWSSFLFGGINEPYADFRAYFDDVLHAAPWMPYFGLVLVPPFLLVGFPVLRLLVRSVEPGPVRDRIALLNHVALLLPVAAWLALNVLASLGRPAFGIVEGKPAWLTSPSLHWLGTEGGFFLLLGLYVLNANLAGRRVGRTA